MIAQEDELGCGVACVANLLDISYAQALQLFDKPENAKTKGFKCKEIMAVLQKSGIGASYKYLKPRLKSKIYQPGVIVLIAVNKKYPFGHYLLRTNHGWLDPWVNIHSSQNVQKAKAGYRKRLPGKPIYAILTK